MVFCKSSLYSNDSGNSGGEDDCGVFVIVFIGLLWCLAFLLKNFRKTSEDRSSLEKPIILQRFDEEANSGSVSTVSIVFDWRLKLSSVISAIEVFFSFLCLMLGIFLQADRCSSISFFLTYSFRIIGWIISFYLIFSSKLEKKSSSVAVLGWSIFQIISSGMNLVYGGISSPSVIFAISIVFMFVLSTIISILMVVHLLRTDGAALFFTSPLDKKLKTGNVGNEEPVRNEPLGNVLNLWASRGTSFSVSNKNPVATDSTIRLSLDSTNSDDIGIERRVLSLDTENKNRDLSKSSSVGPSSLPNSKFDSSMNPLINVSMSSSWSSNISSSMRFREKILGSSNDITVSVVEWSKVNINGKLVAMYKLGIGESLSAGKDSDPSNVPRTVRMVVKRYDEFILLRERILSDLPQINDIPVVPSPPLGEDEPSDETLSNDMHGRAR